MSPELIRPGGEPAKPTRTLHPSSKVALKLNVTHEGDVDIDTAAERVILGKGEWILMPLEVWQATIAKAIDNTQRQLVGSPDRKN